MKSQNDLIAMSVAGAFTVILILVFWFAMHRQVTAPVPPTPVVVSDAALPAAAPVMAAALPQGSGSAGGGRMGGPGAGRMGGPGGGRMGGPGGMPGMGGPGGLPSGAIPGPGSGRS